MHPKKIGAPIYLHENVFLIEANNSDHAISIATKIGQNEISGYLGLKIDDEDAICNFEGVRKIVNVSNPYPLDQDGERPVSGTEITYTEFQVGDRAQLEDFMNKKMIDMKYIE